jgi:3-methyladenine DNA glycosylase AlkD
VNARTRAGDGADGRGAEPTERPPVQPLEDAVLAAVVARFEAAADPTAAVAMRAYMRDQFPFLGIKSARRVELSRAAVAPFPRPTQAEVVAVTRACWARDEREYQYVGCWYARRFVRVLDAGFLPTARFLIGTKSWWDTVDDLAQNVVGPIVRADPSLQARMDEWIDDPDLWIARTALLHQNRYRADTDADRLFAYCRRRADHPDFFIRKAIGWALREYSRVDPDAVRAFATDPANGLSGLSRREALAWLDRRAARA